MPSTSHTISIQLRGPRQVKAMLKSSINQETVFRTNYNSDTERKFGASRHGNSYQELIPRGEDRQNECAYQDTLDLTNELKHAAQQCQLLAGKLQDRRGNARKRPDSPKESLFCETDDDKDELRKKIQALVDENIQLRRRMNKDLLCERIELPESGKDSEITAKLKATTEENIRLRQILKDVTEVNKRWQKYNQDRQDYVQKLLSTIQELEQKSQAQSAKEKVLADSVPNRGHCFHMRHSDSDLLDPSGELAMLRKSHDECLKDNTRLQKECEDMRANFEELIRELENAKQQNKEHEEMLQLQANMFKEDFLAERKEKLTALARISDLEDEVQSLSKKCQDYDRHLQQAERALRQNSGQFNKETFVKQNYNGSSSTYPRAHRPLYQSKSALGCVPQNYVENIGRKRLVSDKATHETSRNGLQEVSCEQFPSEGENTVICPRCAMLFPSNRHSEFLDHYRQCKENKSY